MKLIFTMGIPGCGKTTLAKKFLELPQTKGTIEDFSADKFFETPEGYKYDKSKATEAHAQCFRFLVERTYFKAMNPYAVAVVHNTNTLLESCSPLIALGQAFKCDIYPIHIDTPLEVCKARQTHGVPEDVLDRMHANLQTTLQDWRPYWPEIITIDDQTPFEVIKEKLGL